MHDDNATRARRRAAGGGRVRYRGGEAARAAAVDGRAKDRGGREESEGRNRRGSCKETAGPGGGSRRRALYRRPKGKGPRRDATDGTGRGGARSTPGRACHARETVTSTLRRDDRGRA